VQTNNAIDAAVDIVRRDAGIPGLGLLLDPARLLAGLTGLSDCSRVEKIRLKYLRYKPGMNCLARYELHANGHTTSAYAKAYGQDSASKLNKSAQRAVVDGMLGPGRVVLNEQQIVFSTFPNDAKLVSLQRLGSVDLQQRLFRRVFGPDSEWQTSVPGPALNYKPERRYVTRLERADGECALVKFYSRSGFERARTINRKLGISRQGFYPKIIGRSKKHAVIAYRWQPGTTLRQLNTDGKLALPDLVATAKSLAGLHASGQDGLAPVKPAAQAERLSALAEQTGFLLPHLRQRAMQMAEQLAQWLNGRASARQPVHGDFYDKQAIVRDGQVKLIDLDAAHLGNPLLDLGNYIAHLEKQANTPGMAALDTRIHADTLVDAYIQSNRGLQTDQLSRYIALGLFNLIHQPFRDWQADWPAQTERLLDRAAALFAD